MKMFRLFGVFVVGVSLACLTGCGGEEEETPETPSEGGNAAIEQVLVG